MLVRHRTDSPWRTRGKRASGIRLPADNQALKAQVSSVCSFPIPDALVTLQTERALDFASRIEHAPSPQSSPRKRGEAEWCRVSRTYRRKTRVARCLPSPRSTSATRINYLKLNACFTSPLPLPKGEDEGEGLFFCRSSSANQIARNTLLSSWRT